MRRLRSCGGVTKLGRGPVSFRIHCRAFELGEGGCSLPCSRCTGVQIACVLVRVVRDISAPDW